MDLSKVDRSKSNIKHVYGKMTPEQIAYYKEQAELEDQDQEWVRAETAKKKRKARGTTRIFLCHASEDKPQVREVYQRLKALGFDPWIDEEDILPGQDWAYEIETALETSAFAMVFLSTRSVGKTGYVQREFRRALYHSEEMPEGQLHTIPVKLDDCEVPRRFSRYQWANLSDGGAFDRIVRTLHRGFEQRGLPIPTPPEPPRPADESPADTNEAPPENAGCRSSVYVIERDHHSSGDERER